MDLYRPANRHARGFESVERETPRGKAVASQDLRHCALRSKNCQGREDRSMMEGYSFSRTLMSRESAVTIWQPS